MILGLQSNGTSFQNQIRQVINELHLILKIVNTQIPCLVKRVSFIEYAALLGAKLDLLAKFKEYFVKSLSKFFSRNVTFTKFLPKKSK